VKQLAIVLAIFFFIVAILYATGALQIGSSHPGRHLSHAVLFTVLGVLALVWLRFQSGRSASSYRS